MRALPVSKLHVPQDENKIAAALHFFKKHAYNID